MEDFRHIFVILVILNCVQGISCDNDVSYGLIAASVISGVFLCLLIVLAVVFALWPESHRQSQLKKGKCKIPRSWLDHERDVYYAQKQKMTLQKKNQMKQSLSGMIHQNGDHNVEMHNIYRIRPEIPGSWRREDLHAIGCRVTEVPTVETTGPDNQQLRPNSVEVSPNGLRYAGNIINGITITPPCDIESTGSSLSSSGSTDSTVKLRDKRRFKSKQHEDEEIIEAKFDFQDEDDVDGNAVQERATSF